MQTRFLTINDIPEILKLAKVGVKEVHYWDRIDDDVFISSVSSMLVNSDFFCRGYFDDKGNLCGVFCGVISRCWFNSDMHAEGVTVFILPCARGRGGALKLYQEFTDWASGFDRVKSVSLRTTSGLDLTKIISRIGYKPTGFTYRLEF
jgi:hypothetical protein